MHNGAVDESLDRLSQTLADSGRRLRLVWLSADDGRIGKHLDVPRQAVAVARRLKGRKAAARVVPIWRGARSVTSLTRCRSTRSPRDGFGILEQGRLRSRAELGWRREGACDG